MTLWDSQLTREDKLLSMLKVTGSFYKMGKRDTHDRERDSWLEKLHIKRSVVLICRKTRCEKKGPYISALTVHEPLMLYSYLGS